MAEFANALGQTFAQPRQLPAANQEQDNETDNERLWQVSYTKHLYLSLSRLDNGSPTRLLPALRPSAGILETHPQQRQMRFGPWGPEALPWVCHWRRTCCRP